MPSDENLIFRKDSHANLILDEGHFLDLAAVFYGFL